MDFSTLINALASLKVDFTELELSCLRSILQRDYLQTGSDPVILYSDLLTLIKNFVKKEKLLVDSQRKGLDYRALTEPSFDFLLKLK